MASSVYAKHNLDLESLIFSMYTTDEIKKLCIVKITSPLTFDAMGYPLPGGLYDKAMGPLRRESDPCGTCLKNVLSCPGHFGYIELPLPVVNPVFHKILGSVLKLTCFSCATLQVPGSISRLMSVYINLLNVGLVTEAQEIEILLRHAASYENEPLNEESEKRVKKLDKMAKSVGMNEDTRPLINKTTESLRNQVIHDILVGIKFKKKCMYCKAAIPRIQTFKNRLMTVAKKSMDKSLSEEENLAKAPRSADLKIITAEESKQILRKLWVNNDLMIMELVPVLKRIKSKHPTDIFFYELIPVPPCNVRPVNVVNNQMVEHPQTQVYKSILQTSIVLKSVIHVVQGKSVDTLPEESKAVYELSQGSSPVEKLHSMWQELQNFVDCLMDRDMSISKNDSLGIKQIIEKKKGIIRMHMMGKRVNYAARTVITPDPNLNIDEIGVPEAFAKQLTYPVPVTPWNVEKLRKMVMNGPNVHPGAKMVEFGDGKIYKISEDKKQQETILKRLLTPMEDEKGTFKGVKIVHRHLQNGDILLLNRQPTLHRPSIMAHSARILKGEKTIRLHYANCKAYNADFDGDEMNMHFPQSELARSEGYNLANVCNQYLVPKDGTPLSGLIQDHMISGVKLSVRGRFFKRCDYHQLVYSALSNKTGQIILLPPCILKPEVLWSGKQILSTVIINTVPRNKEPLNLTATAKIGVKNWIRMRSREWLAGGTPFKDPNNMSESEVIIRQGELLCGVLDKTHYGATPYGLIHCMYELYGATYSAKLLSSLAKLFTCFLQQEGFTLGVHDILVKQKADKKRTEIIEECRRIGHATSAMAVDLPPETPEKVLLQKLEEAHSTNPKFRAIIDRQYKQALDTYTNEINKTCLPAGLLCKFPKNNLQLMVQSGAKGSTVNTMQISCLLGQIELEGKRPPVMISGRTLPSFVPFDTTPKAGGFIDGRFMTGILPQEFFFHCMAGREYGSVYNAVYDSKWYLIVNKSPRIRNSLVLIMQLSQRSINITAGGIVTMNMDTFTAGLIDTAVKTSRSGYLQRCLVKHLEGLKVAYDLTVRDSDNSVIQFFYGEDGMDISKVQFLKEKQLKFLSENSKAIFNEECVKELKKVDNYSKMKKHAKKIKEWKENNGDPLRRKRTSPFVKFSCAVQNKINADAKEIDPATGRTAAASFICTLWQKASQEIRESFEAECQPCPNPLNTNFQPDSYFGALTDRLDSMLRNYTSPRTGDQLGDALKLKAMQSLCAPGEPVGLLAAQSIGEPSTQMTLNTFHFAGRGEMNVTLGIPRLREILMMASANIKTPSMEIPFLQIPHIEKKAEALRKSLTRVTVSNVLEKIDVCIQLETLPVRKHRYTLKFHFLPHELYKSQYSVSPQAVIKHMTKKFFPEMFRTIKKLSKLSGRSMLVTDEATKQKPRKKKDDDEEDTEPQNEAEDSSEEEPEGAEEDAKVSSKFKQSREDQEPEEEEVEQSDEEEDEEAGEKSKAATAENGNGEMEENDEDQKFIAAESLSYAQNFIYDSKKYLWCQLVFTLPLNLKNVDFTAVLKETAEKSVVWQVENIKRAITYMKDNKELTLRTDGINITEMFQHDDILDVNRLYSNDIHKIAETYGIEAARKVIVKEVKDVFNVYGITVDPRHLLLIADYMTYNGTFDPMSRRGMECNASPLQQMSFESSLTFLKTASLRGKQDSLSSPSSCVMIGKPFLAGTGSFTLMQKIPNLRN